MSEVLYYIGDINIKKPTYFAWRMSIGMSTTDILWSDTNPRSFFSNARKNSLIY